MKVSRILRLLKFINCFFMLISSVVMADDHKMPTIWNVQSDYDSILREDILEKIHTTFNKENGSVRTVALTGMSGTGKSYLAKMYANKYKHDYDFVWFFHASKNMDLQMIQLANAWNSNQINSEYMISITDKSNIATTSEEIKQFLEKSGKNWLLIFDDLASPSSVVREIKDRLRRTKYDWLMIYDDVNYIDEVRKYIPESHKEHGRSHVIFTSKNQNIWPAEVHVGPFTRSQSIKSILKRNPNLDFETADKIAGILGDYPLTVATAAARIAYDSSTASDLFSEKKLDEGTFTSAVTYIDEMSEKIRNISEGAHKIYQGLSLMSKNYIPEPLLRKYYYSVSGGGPKDFERDISLLEKHLFIKSERREADARYYHTHAIYQYAALSKLTQSQKRTIAENLIRVLSGMYEKGGKVSLDPNYIHILEQTKSLVSISEGEFNFTSPEYISILVELIEFNSMVRREYDESMLYGDRVSADVNKLSSKYNDLKHRYYNDMSGVYWWMGQNRKGLIVQEKALDIHLENDTHSLDERLRGLLYKATHLTYLGELDKSSDTIAQADKHIQQHGFSSINNKTFGLYNSALTSQIKSTVYMNKGLLAKALAEQEIALKNISEISRQFKNKSKSTSRFNYFSNYYEIKMKLSGLANDLDALKSLYGDAKSSLGKKKHRLSGLLLALYAKSNIDNHHLIEGLSLAEKAGSYLRDWFGCSKCHRDQALVYSITADAYIEMKNYALAKEHLLSALETYDNAYVSNITNDYSGTLEKLARVSLLNNDPQEAKKYFKIHASVFGIENDRTLRILRDIKKYNV